MSKCLLAAAFLLPAAAYAQLSPAAKLSEVAANQLGIIEYCHDKGHAGADAVSAEREAFLGAPSTNLSTVHAEELGRNGYSVAPDGGQIPVRTWPPSRTRRCRRCARTSRTPRCSSRRPYTSGSGIWRSLAKLGVRKGSKAFFSEEKKQKTFVPDGEADASVQLRRAVWFWATKRLRGGARLLYVRHQVDV